MLTPQELELLTAHVDGELTSRQRRQVARLLRRSGDARALLEALMRDSRELHLLPPVPAPHDISASVLDVIAARKVRLASAKPAPARASASFLGYAAAAAVLLAVGVGSFLTHRPGPDAPPDRGPVVKKPDEKPPEPREVEKTPVIVKKDPETPPPAPSWVETPPTIKIVPGEEPDEPEEPAVPPSKGEKPTAVLASGQREPMNQLERVEFSLPRIHVFHGLDVPEQGKALREQLTMGSGYRIEIPARDAGRGLERVRAALAGLRAAFTLTPEAQARLKAGLKGDYAVYVENVAAEDLAEALRLAGNADRAAAQKRAVDRHFEGPLIVRDLGRFDRRELKELLGVDPLDARPSPRPAAVDIRKPLEEGTSTAVSDALDGRGVPRPGVARGPSVGVVLTLPALKARSAELKRFLESRPAARPGTLQVLIVIRNVG